MDINWIYRQNGRHLGDNEIYKVTPRTHTRMPGRPKTRWRDDIDGFQTHQEDTENYGVSLERPTTEQGH